MRKYFYLLLLIAFNSCESSDCCQDAEDKNSELIGSWLLIERGYSPGDHYITEPVSPTPPQTITFKPGKVLGPGMFDSANKFYKIIQDTVSQGQIVSLYNQDPETPTSKPKEAYNFSIENDMLTLNFRWCVEGCHLKFKRINDESL